VFTATGCGTGEGCAKSAREVATWWHAGHAGQHAAAATRDVTFGRQLRAAAHPGTVLSGHGSPGPHGTGRGPARMAASCRCAAPRAEEGRTPSPPVCLLHRVSRRADADLRR